VCTSTHPDCVGICSVSEISCDINGRNFSYQDVGKNNRMDKLFFGKWSARCQKRFLLFTEASKKPWFRRSSCASVNRRNDSVCANRRVVSVGNHHDRSIFFQSEDPKNVPPGKSMVQFSVSMVRMPLNQPSISNISFSIYLVQEFFYFIPLPSLPTVSSTPPPVQRTCPCAPVTSV
jgi:hypothetical protein